MVEQEKVLKDPVHGYIYVHHPLIWDLINTREMQRLRRIRQLGTTYFAYPGGDHSRFSHSLGAYEVVRQILQAFERNGYAWPRHLTELAWVAGLLHDIGHTPFSHALEKQLKVRHEKWSEQIVVDPRTEVHQVLESYANGLSHQVAQVLNKTHPEKLVVSLVSSQLDADRLDYLMRDSVATGVDYGKFDLARIIRIMRPYQGRIVVRESGIHTVEAYLLARYFMYWQVYFHPVSRAGEVVLRAVIKRAAQLRAQGESLQVPHPALEDFLQGDVSLPTFLALDDAVVMTAFALWQDSSDSVLADLSRRFLDRRLLKEVAWHGGAEELEAVRSIVAQKGFDPDYYCVIDSTSTVYYDYYPGSRKPPDEDNAIWLLHPDSHQLTEMSSLSPPIQAIAKEHRGVCRLFVPSEVLADPTARQKIAQLAETGNRGPSDGPEDMWSQLSSM